VIGSIGTVVSMTPGMTYVSRKPLESAQSSNTFTVFAERPGRDAGLLEILEETGSTEGQVEEVAHVEQRDVVRLAHEIACAHAREQPALRSRVELVDPVAAGVDVSRVLVLVVEGERVLVELSVSAKRACTPCARLFHSGSR